MDYSTFKRVFYLFMLDIIIIKFKRNITKFYYKFYLKLKIRYESYLQLKYN